jgi:hypothetical protein
MNAQNTKNEVIQVLIAQRAILEGFEDEASQKAAEKLTMAIQALMFAAK